MIKRPTTLDEALSLKHRFGLGATFLAGGTDLVVGVRKGKRRVETLIDLSRLDELRTLSREGDRLRIGAMCTHTQLEASGITALAEASETVGGTQIRNLGTLGGQLGTASPAGDVSVALIALCAEVELLSVRGARSLPLADFFVGPGRTVLGPDEIVCAVSVPTDRRSAFYKLGKRDAVAISLVMAAASVGPSGDVAIGLGCVAPVPLRAKRAEAHLATHGLSAASIDAAAAIVADDVKPITDHRGSADYRRAMAATLTRRILVSLAERASA